MHSSILQEITSLRTSAGFFFRSCLQEISCPTCALVHLLCTNPFLFFAVRVFVKRLKGTWFLTNISLRPRSASSRSEPENTHQWNQKSCSGVSTDPLRFMSNMKIFAFGWLDGGSGRLFSDLDNKLGGGGEFAPLRNRMMCLASGKYIGLPVWIVPRNATKWSWMTKWRINGFLLRYLAARCVTTKPHSLVLLKPLCVPRTQNTCALFEANLFAFVPSEDFLHKRRESHWSLLPSRCLLLDRRKWQNLIVLSRLSRAAWCFVISFAESVFSLANKLLISEKACHRTTWHMACASAIFPRERLDLKSRI